MHTEQCLVVRYRSTDGGRLLKRWRNKEWLGWTRTVGPVARLCVAKKGALDLQCCKSKYNNAFPHRQSDSVQFWSNGREAIAP
jgi:hypothetical protein